MRTKVYLLLTVVLLPFIVHAQTSIFFGATYGNYAMGDLKRLQSYYISQAGSGGAFANINRNYPAGFGYMLN